MIFVQLGQIAPQRKVLDPLCYSSPLSHRPGISVSSPRWHRAKGPRTGGAGEAEAPFPERLGFTELGCDAHHLNVSHLRTSWVPYSEGTIFVIGDGCFWVH